MKTRFWIATGLLTLAVSPLPLFAQSSGSTTSDDGRVLSTYAQEFFVSDTLPPLSSAATTPTVDNGWTCGASVAGRMSASMWNSFRGAWIHLAGAVTSAPTVRPATGTEETSEPERLPMPQLDIEGGCPFKILPACPMSSEIDSTVLRNFELLEEAHGILADADTARKQGDFAEAVRLYQKVRELCPGSRFALSAEAHLSATASPRLIISEEEEPIGPTGAMETGITPQLPGIDSSIVGAMAELQAKSKYRGSRTTRVEVHSSPLTGEETSEPPIADPVDDWTLPLLILEPVQVPLIQLEIEANWSEIKNSVGTYFHNATGIEIDARRGTFRAMVRGVRIGN